MISRTVDPQGKRQFHPSILREYDIRGIVGETLFPEDAAAIGRAFGTAIVRSDGKTVCCGCDGRVSSPELEKALVEGLASTGLEVQRVGRGPTPMLYYAGTVREAGGAIMVTGSHNPPTHNGFKMMLGGKPFFADQIQMLGRIAAEGDFAASGTGRVLDAPVLDEYVARLVEGYEGGGYDAGRPLRAVWDPGNGAAGEALARLLPRLPGENVMINGEIDGTFPNHHPDPTEPENLEQLIAEVKARGADLGFAFDGDGDRIGVVDARGRILWGDQIMMLLAEEVLARKPGATIIADVKASKALFDRIAALGGKPLMWRTGHSLIKTKMVETGAPLAGEMSGHLFFADRYYGFDDALYAAVRFLSMASRWRGASLADRYDALPRLFNTPEIRIPCPDERKFAVISDLKARLATDGAEVSDIDGVRVTTPEGWWLLRASNTQAVLVARCESSSEDGLVRLRAIVRDQIAIAGLRAQI